MVLYKQLEELAVLAALVISTPKLVVLAHPVPLAQLLRRKYKEAIT